MWREKLSHLVEGLPHPAWGAAHVQRVYAMTLRLAGEEDLTIEEEALYAAAHLHDLGALPPYRRTGMDHAERSAAVAGELLPSLGFPPAKLELVQEIILHHMFGADPGPSAEAILFRDADTLDFLGAIGLARLLSLVGLDDWTPDLPAAITLSKRFGRELPDRLCSRSAKGIGRIRQGEMEAFLGCLGEETLDWQAI